MKNTIIKTIRRKTWQRLLAGLSALLVMAALCPTSATPAQAADGPGTLHRGPTLGEDIEKYDVRTITFQNSIPTKGTCWDAGLGNTTTNVPDGSVRGCATASSVDSSMWDVVYGADGAYPKFPTVSFMLFDRIPRLVSINNLDKIDTSNVTNMGEMFWNCWSLTELDVTKFNTSNVVYMHEMFKGCDALAKLDVSNFDTRNVISMSSMFRDCKSLTKLDVSKWNTSNVTNMYDMFCSSGLTELDLSNFDTSKVTNMSYMFSHCKSLVSLDVSSFDTSNVTKIGYMLNGLSKLQELKLGKKFTQQPGIAGYNDDWTAGAKGGPNLGEPDGSATRTGYTNIQKWRNMGTGESYDSASLIPGGAAATYTPFKPIEYRVQFDKNVADATGSMEAQSFTYDKEQTLSANGLTRTGYTLAGWNTKADGKGTSYTNGQSVKNLTATAGDTVTLYAQWEGSTTSITFDPNGGTGSMSPVTGKVGEQCKLTSNGFTREGYTFAGWNTKADGKGTAYADGATIPCPATSLTVYAQWTANASKLTYNANGGTGSISDTTGATGQKVTVSDNKFTRDGYGFTGWNTKADGSGDAITPGSQFTLKAQPTVVYAQWKALPSSITYKANRDKATGSTPDTTGVTGQQVTVSANGYKVDGWTFTGWNTKADGSGDSVAPGSKFTLKSTPTTVYAQWSANSAATKPDTATGTGEGTTSAGTTSTDTTPAGTTPTDTTPTGTTPADTTPAGTAPVDTTPADATPADTTPADTATSADAATPAAPLAQTGATASIVALIGALLVCLAAGLCLLARDKRHGK